MAENTRGNAPSKNPNQREEQSQGHDRQDPDAQKLKGAGAQGAQNTRGSEGQNPGQSSGQKQGQSQGQTRGQPAPGGNRGPDTGVAGQHAGTHDNAGNVGRDADKSRGLQGSEGDDEDRESAEISTKPRADKAPTASGPHMSRDDDRKNRS